MRWRSFENEERTGRTNVDQTRANVDQTNASTMNVMARHMDVQQPNPMGYYLYLEFEQESEVFGTKLGTKYWRFPSPMAQIECKSKNGYFL